MLKIKNVDKIEGECLGIYKISSVKNFSNSYSFAVLDTDDACFFRIDLMKERDTESGKWLLRWSPTKYFKLGNGIIQNKDLLLSEIIYLVKTHRKPIKIK